MSNRGDEFLAEAEKKLSGWSLFTSRETRTSDASQLFAKAGNSFKSVREFKKAGAAYMRAYDCLLKLNQLQEAGQMAADAGKMFASTIECQQEAVASFRRAVQIFRENGKQTQAARLLVECAQTFRGQSQIVPAIEVLTDAAQIYEDEGQGQMATAQLALIGDLQVERSEWVEAAVKYKVVAERRAADRLLQLSATEFVQKQVLCLILAEDVVAAEQAVADAGIAIPGWDRQREAILLREVIEAVQGQDAEAVSRAAATYDQFKPLPDWATRMLLKVKESLNAQAML